MNNDLTAVKTYLAVLAASVLREPLDIRDDHSSEPFGFIVNNMIYVTKQEIIVEIPTLVRGSKATGLPDVGSKVGHKVDGFCISTIVTHGGGQWEPPSEDFIDEEQFQRAIDTATAIIKRLVAIDCENTLISLGEHMYAIETEEVHKPAIDYSIVVETRLVKRDENGMDEIKSFARSSLSCFTKSARVANQTYRRIAGRSLR